MTGRSGGGRVAALLAAALGAVAVLSACGSAAATGGGGGGAAAPAARHLLGFSTDDVIARDQARLRAEPHQQAATDELAGAYLQKVREVGDPSYYPKVEALLRDMLTRHPDDAEAITLMGVLELARHHFLEGLGWGNRARALDPYSSRALGVVVDADVELGRDDDAVRAAQAMVDLRPDLSSYARVSYIRELHGDVSGAVEAMRMAVEAGGPAPENTAYTGVLLGNLWFDQGRLDDARIQYRRVLAADPTYVQALAALAKVDAAQGRSADAITEYRRAIAVYPAPDFVIALGDVQAVSGHSADAQRSYDLAAAEQALYRANGVDLDAELALFDADHGRDLPGALAAARRAAHDRPSVQTFDVLAWTLDRTGDLRGALAASTQAHRLGTRNALFFFHTGMIEMGLGMRTAAIADLTTALTINPAFSLLHAPEARAALATLEATA